MPTHNQYETHDLSTLFSDPTVAQLYSSSHDELPESPSPRVKPKKTHRIPVPEHLKGNFLPADIKRFLTDLYPNMLVYSAVQAHVHPSSDDAQGILHDFVTYILANDSDGCPRWRRYDATRGAPFFKYLLAQIRFFVQDWRNKDNKLTTLSTGIKVKVTEYGIDTDPENRRPGTVLDTALPPADNEIEARENEQEYLHRNREIELFLSVKQDEARDIGMFCMQAYALDLWKMKLSETPRSEIAHKLGISVSAVGQWWSGIERMVLTRFARA